MDRIQCYDNMPDNLLTSALKNAIDFGLINELRVFAFHWFQLDSDLNNSKGNHIKIKPNNQQRRPKQNIETMGQKDKTRQDRGSDLLASVDIGPAVDLTEGATTNL